MGVDKIVRLVAVVVAIVAGFVALPQEPLIIALLGVAGGWFIAADDRQRFLISAIALNIAHAGLDGITGIGPYISMALGGLNSLFLAGAATVIVLGIVDRLKP